MPPRLRVLPSVAVELSGTAPPVLWSTGSSQTCTPTKSPSGDGAVKAILIRSVVSSANSLVAETLVTSPGAVGVFVLLEPPPPGATVETEPPMPASARQYSCTPTIEVPLMAFTRTRKYKPATSLICTSWIKYDDDDTPRGVLAIVWI